MENDFLLWNRTQANLARIKDEYASFVHSACCKISRAPYKWWAHPDQRQTYPNLSQMAIDLLSIPAMSAEPERVFSGARRLLSWERMRLGSDKIEMNECLKSFIRIRMKQDDNYITELRRLTDSITPQAPVDTGLTGRAETVATVEVQD